MEERHAGRILLVVPEGADEFTASVLERLDHPVTTCHGPRPGKDCPMVHGEGCPWFEDAHGVVFSLDLSLPAHRAILHAYRELAAAEGRDVPIRVVAPPDADRTEVDAALVWSHEPSVAELDGFAALVEAADRFA